jgi:alginate O-acetyltransferase complex protein AlgJ
VARFCNRLLVFVFLAILACPSIVALLRWKPMDGLDEKRALAKEPPRTAVRWSDLTSIADYARSWETYYGDHYGLRKVLIGGYRLASLHLLRLSLNPAVVVGLSDGHSRWLYYHGSAANDGAGFEGLLGQKPYTQAELAAIAANLARLAKMFTDSHLKFQFVVAPDKQTIYPEYLPRSMRPQPGVRSRLDQVSEVAQRVLGTAYLDLRPTILQAKREGVLYFAQDSHWNPAAGYVVYRRLMEALRLQDPTRTALPKDAFRLEPSPLVVGDLIDLAGVPRFSRELLLMPVLSAPLPPGHKHGKLLIYYDSYFREFLKRYLEAEFEQVKIYYCSHRASASIVTQAAIDAEKPDMIIIEASERYWTW